MIPGIPDAVLIAVVSVAGAFVGSWAALGTRLRQMRLAINAAHRRLDKINAPPADLDALAE